MYVCFVDGSVVVIEVNLVVIADPDLICLGGGLRSRTALFVVHFCSAQCTCFHLAVR